MRGQPDMPFLFVGNHPALDFVNTQLRANGQPLDLLTTYSDLVTWMVQARLAGKDEEKTLRRLAGEAKSAQTLERARVFRNALREMVERIASGKSVPEEAIRSINEMLRYRMGYPQLTRRKGTIERGFQAHSEENWLPGLLAEAATDLVCTCDLSLIKKCQNPDCVIFFYDTTKNHARRWCSMSLCGNRSKVAAHYHRHLRPGRLH
jgi:predicted RNA-binding Zn ribbon-like protein